MARVTNDLTLVLGGGGFLGAHVVAVALQRSQARVVSASRTPGAGARVWGSAASLVERELDVLRAGAAEALIEELIPTRIVLCTALSRISECAAYPGLARALNVEFPRRVARFTAERGARLVHISTDLVYGDREPPAEGWREEDAVGPLSIYGQTKAQGERAVLETDTCALVVRLPLLFGDSGGRDLGASESLLAAVERGEQPVLFRDEFRTPLAVHAAAGAVVELCERNESGILHVAGSERVSRYELGLAVLRASGMSEAGARSNLRATTRAESGLESTRPADVSLDSSRARSFLRTRLSTVRAAQK